MARASAHKTVQVTLNLIGDEAEYLLGLTQNFQGSQNEEDSPEENKLRCAVFHALKEALYDQY